MAITVAALAQTIIDACDNNTYNDGAGVDTVDFKQNSASVYWTKKASGNNDCTFTPSAAVDLSGTGVHVRFWGLFLQGSLINLAASGGIQFWASDGSNTGYWYLGGRDTYSGGWAPFCVDVSAGVDSGTKPTAMNAITSMGLRLNLTGTSKNFDNTWMDYLHVCDGLRAYGDDAGGYFDLEDIFSADATDTSSTVGGWGIVTKFAGIYFTSGGLEVGDSVSTNACKFQAKNQTLVFEDKDVNAALYSITVVDNGTGLTEFLLGEKAGTAGVSGCTIQVEDSAQAAKVDFVATDADITNFGIYGSTFIGLDDISLPATSTITEVLNSNFSACGTVVVDTCTLRNCNFINATGNAIEIDSLSNDVEDCTFITPTTAGVEISAAPTGDYDFDGMEFVGTTGSGPYDVNNTSGSEITINVNSGNAQYYTGSVVNFIIAPVTITLTVKDIVTTDEIAGARSLVLVADSANFPYQASVTIERSGAVATVSHTGHGMETGDKVYISGANQWEYNGVHEITYIGTGSYSYAVVGTPDTPATGTITATFVILDEDTDTGGVAADTRSYSNHQLFTGRVREGDVGPYKDAPLQGTIDKASGYSTVVQLIPDS